MAKSLNSKKGKREFGDHPYKRPSARDIRRKLEREKAKELKRSQHGS